MHRLLALTLALLFVMGCRYQPLDYEENRPELEDAIIQRELVAFGESRIHYWQNNSHVCSVVTDIEGWIEEEVDAASVGCVGCTENFTLGFFTNDDSSCAHAVAGAATIALTPISFFPRDDQPGWQWDLLNEDDEDELPDGAGGPAVGYVTTNWSPFGSSDWDPRMALYPAADETGLDSYSREYYARGFYLWQGAEAGDATWEMDLWLTQ